MKDFTETDVPPTVGDGDRRSDARGRTEHDWVQDACYPKRSRGCRGEGANGEDSFGTPSEVELESQIEKSAKNYTRVKPTQQQAKEHTQQQGTRTWPTANETRVSQKLSQLRKEDDRKYETDDSIHEPKADRVNTGEHAVNIKLVLLYSMLAAIFAGCAEEFVNQGGRRSCSEVAVCVKSSTSTSSCFFLFVCFDIKMALHEKQK